MTVHTPGGLPWPARCAYAAAGLFSAASGITNLLYGIAKGTDFGTSLVWGAVSVAVSIVFALSWPAALITYSVSAALGSAMGGRASAAIEEQDAKDRKARAQAKWDAANAAGPPKRNVLLRDERMSTYSTSLDDPIAVGSSL
jgi:hypothetical protein